MFSVSANLSFVERRWDVILCIVLTLFNISCFMTLQSVNLWNIQSNTTNKVHSSLFVSLPLSLQLPCKKKKRKKTTISFFFNGFKNKLFLLLFSLKCEVSVSHSLSAAVDELSQELPQFKTLLLECKSRNKVWCWLFEKLIYAENRDLLLDNLRHYCQI